MFEKSSHSEWLSLLEVSGPFLAEPVLDAHFPQGLDGLDPLKRRHIRQAYEEWREAQDNADPDFEAFHKAWIDLVLKETLELDEDGDEEVLKHVAGVEEFALEVPEYGVTISPDYAVVASDDQSPSLLIQTLSAGVDIGVVNKADAYAASPVERMVQLCRAKKVRLGLLTNGERWMLIDAPEGGVTSYASWYARLWSQEPVTLQAFFNLLGIRRFFLDSSQQLPALLDESVKHQDEVTDALGGQVSRAVEVLIQALDKADQDKSRALLKGIEPDELYEAGLTIMMRLVFLLSAEERGLLLLGDERYEAHYAVSSLRMQLREQAGLHSEEILSHRRDAWSRLLAIFRAVYGGVEHESMRMPALGGSLFDPDRFPFLEGRAKGSNWRHDPAKPLPIDNRTVLLLLDAIQLYQGRTLSYRALDVEQIGYVYEGLLERSVIRASDITLEVSATKSSKKSWVTWGELENARLSGEEAVKALLKERSGSSESRIKNDLSKSVSDAEKEKLLVVCQGDSSLRDRLAPFYHFLRIDPWGYPLIYLKGAFMVSTGSDRRETGTHYTPKSLTESIVKETLEPVAYIGPAEGANRSDWRLKSPAGIMDLKVCDLAMGSGAFLVQACRWLSERLLEAWNQSEALGKSVTSDGIVVDDVGNRQSLPIDSEERLIIARRLISERCLYGVDVNPMAVELAKLSIWLVTLAKGRPFGFLDHNLRHGDSLLGITDLDQLRYLDMHAGKGSEKKLFAQRIDEAVKKAMELRSELRERPILDIHDIDVMAHLDQKARKKLELPELVADALIAETLRSGRRPIEVGLLSIEVGQVLEGDPGSLNLLQKNSEAGLATDLPIGKNSRKPFHWCLEFPEVFERKSSGFDAIVGNPPFMGGKRITANYGVCYRELLVKNIGFSIRAYADLVVYFLIRAHDLIKKDGIFGLLSVNSISEGESRRACLEPLIAQGASIVSATSDLTWPGAAVVAISKLNIYKGLWGGKKNLNGLDVSSISAFLTQDDDFSQQRLKQSSHKCFQGSVTVGKGFVISEEIKNELLSESDSYLKILFPFINGKDLNGCWNNYSGKWVINFWDWSLEEAKLYKKAIAIVEAHVKPEREKNKKKSYRESWWQFGEKCPGLYYAAGRGNNFKKTKKPAWCEQTKPLARVIAVPRVSNKFLPQLIDNKFIYSDSLAVICVDSEHHYAILNSSVFRSWVELQSSSLTTNMRFTPTDCYETFPFDFFSEVEDIDVYGKELHRLRVYLMEYYRIGITKLYSMVDDKDNKDEIIQEIRRISEKIDLKLINKLVCDKVNVNFGFFSDRYTIDPITRSLVLSALKQKNQYFAQVEVCESGKNKIKKRPSYKKITSSQEDLFDDSSEQ